MLAAAFPMRALEVSLPRSRSPSLRSSVFKLLSLFVCMAIYWWLHAPAASSEPDANVEPMVNLTESDDSEGLACPPPGHLGLDPVSNELRCLPDSFEPKSPTSSHNQ